MRSDPYLISPLEMARIVKAFRARFDAEGVDSPRRFGKPSMPVCPQCQHRPSSVSLREDRYQATVVSFDPCGHSVTPRIEAVSEEESRQAVAHVLRSGVTGQTVFGLPGT